MAQRMLRSVVSTAIAQSPRATRSLPAISRRHIAPSSTIFNAPRFSRSASTVPSNSPTVDPSLLQAQSLLEQGTGHLENGNMEEAKQAYKKSLEVQESGSAYYNLGVCEYQLHNYQAAIDAFDASIRLAPSSDAHMNLASCYVMLGTKGNPFPPAANASSDSPLQLATFHLKKAVDMDPRDPEIRFNLGAVLEANDQLEDALTEYTAAKNLGISRADQNIRNVGAKLLRKKADAQSGSS